MIEGRHYTKKVGGALLRRAEIAPAVTTPDVAAQLYLIGRGETPRAKAASHASRVHFSRPGSREAQAERKRRLWADPLHRAKMMALRKKTAQSKRWRRAMKKVWHGEKTQSKKSIAAAKRWRNPVYRAKIIASVTSRWKDLEYRAKTTAVLARARAARRAA